MSDDKKSNADIDGDGIIDKKEKELFIEKLESQSKMAWIAFWTLICCGIYLIGFADPEKLKSAGELGMFWLGLVSIIGFFFGVTAYANKK